MRSPLPDRRGFALESTIILLVLLTALVGAAIASMLIIQRTAGVDYRGSRVSYAAEAAADNVMSQLAADVSDGVISDVELGALQAPAVTGFTFTTPTGTRVGVPVPKTITDGPFAGLIGLNQQIDVQTTARDATGNQSTVIVTVNAQAIPLFQFGVFFQGDLEIHNGPRMDFAGWVHANGNIYLTSNNTFFQDNITTSDSLFWRRKATAERLNGVFINNNAGTPVTLDFDTRSAPGTAFKTQSLAKFDGRVMTAAMGVTALNLPLPPGMLPEAMVAEKSVLDDAAVQEVKFAWKADMHIVVHLDHLDDAPANFCNWAGGGALDIDRGGKAVPPGAACGAIFDGVSNAFHDGRENIGVDVLNINVLALQDWYRINAPADQPQILYIHFVCPGCGGTVLQQRARDYPAVRIRNGATLQFPITISTDAPVYMQGHYNSIGWQPSAILGDAITYLSPAWADANAPWNPNWDPAVTQAYAVVNAAPMTVFAAIAAGHSATPCDVNRVAPACNPALTVPPPLTGGTLPNYGGGLENFPRFLENWGGVQMTYRGSMVSLYQSQFARRYRWQWRNYYSPPQRDWQFDLRFRDPNQLPPGTPTVGSVVQTAFRPVY